MMVCSSSYIINGFKLEFTAGGYFGDGITIPPDLDVTQEGFLGALEIAQVLYPDFYDYGVKTDYYAIYYPSHREVPERFADVRQQFVTMLQEQSVEQHENHKLRVERQDAEAKAKIREKKSGYIYLIRAITPDSHYKIGLSKTPVTRIESLGVMLPFPVEPIHQFQTCDMSKAEKSLHKKYADKRVNGEWFALLPEDVEDICCIQSMDFTGAQS
jgi:hypothetical protein